MPFGVTRAASIPGAACVVLAAACSAPGEHGPVTLAFVDDPVRRGDVVVHPAPAIRSPDEMAAALSVHVGDTSARAMLGSWAVSGDTLRFRPRFPPAAGVTYVARFTPASAAAGGVITTRWTWLPERGMATTVVAAIHPSADTLPMNLLRMYLQFSAPMTTGRSYQHIRLYADGDSLVEEPFFTGGDAIELWDPDKTRLTILFDPGRIKRDLVPHEQAGLPLRSGVRYRLAVDSAWHDAEGRPLARGFEHWFVVGPQDRALVRVEGWRVTAPSSGGREALEVGFPESLDHALLHRMLVIRDSAGALVTGTASVGRAERSWSFVPLGPWRRATYRIEVDTDLEDLAGNTLRRLFDVAPGDSGAIGVQAPRVSVPFTPR